MTEDLKKFEDDSIVGEDSRGYGLTHYVLSERLMQVEHSTIREEMNKDGHSDTLIYMLDGGFRGFHKMSPGELWSEWKDGAEAKWFEMYDDESLPYSIYEEDPLEQEAEQGRQG